MFSRRISSASGTQTSSRRCASSVRSKSAAAVAGDQLWIALPVFNGNVYGQMHAVLTAGGPNGWLWIEFQALVDARELGRQQFAAVGADNPKVNLFGDWILEFGILPVPPMGENVCYCTTCYFSITGRRIYGTGHYGDLRQERGLCVHPVPAQQRAKQAPNEDAHKCRRQRN